MFQIVLLFCLVSGPALAAGAEFTRAPDFSHRGPASARGALVWVPGTYGADQSGPPAPPDFIAREAASGLDVWYYNRDRGDDPLDRGAEMLVTGITSLREQGYRRVLLAGHSRGAWIALTALAHPGLTNAVIAFSPAAHGPRQDRSVQALADWNDLWRAAVNNGTRVVMVQLSDDPYDLDPQQRLDIATKRLGANLLSIFHPADPKGHSGVYEPSFDELFGARIAAFVR